MIPIIYLDSAEGAEKVDKILKRSQLEHGNVQQIVDGILASFAICRMKDSIRVSARSTGKINVQKILESIGGGGHYDSAATELRCSIDEAHQMLLAAIDKYLDE